MDIVILGSGNVAAVLGRKFKAAGHNILQIVSRNASVASKLAYEWDTESTNYSSIINRNADVYIIAVSDDAIDDVVADLQLPRKVVAHTAASVSKDVLKNVSDHYGVFYPLQTLHKEDLDLPEAPIFFDGSDDITKKKLEALANSISPKHVSQAGDDVRSKLHVAAVFVNNFTNHLYALAENYCKKEGIDFKELFPLIEETISRIKDISPSNSQTGPAARNDEETIEKHLKLLQPHPQLKKVYEALTTSIQEFKA
ncbi:MAG TPA: Rossmann-like and DUF2520 domain-containing protein [Chitinophagaceae bacterium]|jgi:predicted short-subunit dehydrogenase-like oxidoreductase (DUF2520 family)|nr:Rossmann-like and DUF2520 domain-containing protein [Chitinophagaceae bacterium]